jgi:hypothetical protein
MIFLINDSEQLGARLFLFLTYLSSNVLNYNLKEALPFVEDLNYVTENFKIDEDTNSRLQSL